MFIPREELINIYHSLQKIRKVELKIEELYHLDEMKTPVHLSLGQEAVAVAVCSQLKREDSIFSNHRSHAHYLAKGGNLKAMIAEFYCKETGCSKGRGGSMHLVDTSVSHYGSSSIVGGSISHAVGAALAYSLQKKECVAVSFFGDAATEEGVFFESMNLAALKNLPVLFICENNDYSVCSHISVRQPNTDIYQRASAFNIPACQVDGMNVFDVYHRAKEALSQVRSGGGPYFLECKVQRWRGHAGAGDPNKELYRLECDLDETRRRDSIAEYKTRLIQELSVDEKDLDQIDAELDQEIEEAFCFAQESPLPDKSELEKYLYAEE